MATKFSQVYSGPDKIITPIMIKDKIKIKGTKMVNKIKDSLSSQWAAPVLLALVLSYNIYNGQQTNVMLTNQGKEIGELKQSLTILKTQKEETEKIHERDRLEFKREVEEQRVRRENLQDKVNTLEYVVMGNGRRK